MNTHHLAAFCRKSVWQQLPPEPHRILTLTADELQRAGASSAEIRKIQAAQSIAAGAATWTLQDPAQTKSPATIANYIAKHLQALRYAPAEEYWGLPLSTKMAPLTPYQVTRGTATNSIAHPREYFSPAILQRATSLCSIHNHPSGDLTPSAGDRDVWQRMEQAGIVLGIPTTDDFIVSRRGIYSRQEEAVILRFD